MRPLSLFVQTAARPHPTAGGRQPLRATLPPWSSFPRAFHKGPRDTVSSHSHPDEYSFERLGLRPSVLSALRLAFPSIKHPTPIQHRFIEAVLKGNDVLLKDKTGSGKSFAAVLALLGQKRGKPYRSNLPGATAPVLPITSLVLVPHRDLAYQFFHWIERIHHHMTPQEPLPSLAQVLVRGSTKSFEDNLASVQHTPPHILIGTPQALLDVVQTDPKALPLNRLSTVVVDEVDYLIETVPALADKIVMEKIERKISRHPGPTRLLLNHIFSAADTQRDSSDGKSNAKHPKRPADDGPARPQLVMMSATLRNHLRKFLLAESGWFSRESGKIVRITGEVSPHDPNQQQQAPAAEFAAEALGGTSIQHHVIVVSEGGSIANIEGAVDAHAATGPEEPKAEASSSDASLELPPLPESSQAPDADFDIDTPSPFNPSALEAIAAAFALDVPSVGLLVLPSDAPVQRAVYELRLLGVNAHGLDVVKDETGRVHLMRQDLDGPTDTPTLLVSTLASTRGLDLPELTHVFILGLLDNGAVDSYLHVAGRVGRFGRGGKVVSVLADRHEVVLGNGKKKVRDEPRMMSGLLRKVGIKPTKFEHFD
ncbi:P-loop containing nucleoside triphosphate hydrolase protein [Trametes elegans]|nr:P-loop containing nucleoside triphosphate hydrolase protein [Trametes elegans]